MATTLKEIATALRKYAVETFDDEELLEEIKGATTLEDAIKKISPLLRALDGRRKDVEATRW